MKKLTTFLKDMIYVTTSKKEHMAIENKFINGYLSNQNFRDFVEAHLGSVENVYSHLEYTHPVDIANLVKTFEKNYNCTLKESNY